MERQIEKLGEAEAALYEEMAAAATDPGKLREIGERQAALATEREELEAAWMEASEAIEG
ncbi:unannotated protein [freshwater metagenome]|uniref:Unannotated protein n=1 Tax=freshwater metagenome TaxID=449393 RepID=A0A6J7K2I3_9ZZZZ